MERFAKVINDRNCVKKVRILNYSVRMWENADQNNSKHKNFLRNEEGVNYFCKTLYFRWFTGVLHTLLQWSPILLKLNQFLSSEYLYSRNSWMGDAICAFSKGVTNLTCYMYKIFFERLDSFSRCFFFNFVCPIHFEKENQDKIFQERSKLIDLTVVAVVVKFIFLLQIFYC